MILNYTNQILFMVASFPVLALTWFIRTFRSFLFWVYLWQLKDYHAGRFLDHFRTEKGKKLLLGPLPIIKVILLLYALVLPLIKIGILWQFYAAWIIALSILYIFESYKLTKEIVRKTIKHPIFTLKTMGLMVLLVLIQAVFLYVIYARHHLFVYWFAFYLLLFDILTPLIVTVVVFLVHFFTVILFRNRVIMLAKKKRADFNNLLVIGITGSYGKSSTKEFLYQIVSGKFKTLKTQDNKNSEVGISQTILQELNRDHQVLIVEMGAYNKQGISLLSGIVQPKIGIVTGVNEQHLSTFGSMENLISAEGGKELINNLPADGLVIVNGLNRYCLELAQNPKITTKIVGIAKSEAWAENIKTHKDHVTFKAVFKDGKSISLDVKIVGSFNIENLLMAIVCAKELGMNLDDIKNALGVMPQFPHQMELKKGNSGVDLIDSTYSANPDSVLSHLDHLKNWDEKKIIIMPCLIELGEKTAEVHMKIGQKIAEICDLAIILTKEQYGNIQQGAIKSGMNEKDIIYLDDQQEIINRLRPYLTSKNIILLEGRMDPSLIKSILNA